MNYRDYKTARDLSWNVLIQFGISKLPVKVSNICKQNRCRLYSYAEGICHIKAFRLEAQCEKSDGFSTLYAGNYYIFYNSNMTIGRIRFTIAHEIGHILFGHLKTHGSFTTKNREPNPTDAPEEQMANVFASRLLAPACVLNALDATTPEQIAALCDISLQSATYRAERMGTLRSRQKFGTSPLEREVYQQFIPYINAIKEI